MRKGERQIICALGTNSNSNTLTVRHNRQQDTMRHRDTIMRHRQGSETMRHKAAVTETVRGIERQTTHLKHPLRTYFTFSRAVHSLHSTDLRILKEIQSYCVFTKDIQNGLSQTCTASLGKLALLLLVSTIFFDQA